MMDQNNPRDAETERQSVEAEAKIISVLMDMLRAISTNLPIVATLHQLSGGGGWEAKSFATWQAAAATTADPILALDLVAIALTDSLIHADQTELAGDWDGLAFAYEAWTRTFSAGEVLPPSLADDPKSCDGVVMYVAMRDGRSFRLVWLDTKDVKVRIRVGEDGAEIGTLAEAVDMVRSLVPGDDFVI